MHLTEAKKILNKNGYKLIEVYGNSDSEILADPSFWDYSKQVQHRFKNDGGFIIKPEEQEKLLNNRYYINILKDNSIRLPKQYIQRFTQPFVEKIILACYKGNMNVKDAAYYLGEFSYQAGTMVKSDWEQWVARQLSTFNESVNESFDNELATYVDEMLSINPNKGEIEFYSRDALNDAWAYLKSLGYKLQYTSDVDENLDNVTHYIEYEKNVNESMTKQNDGNLLNEGLYSDIELIDLEVKAGDLYATFVFDTDKYIKDYNIYSGDEFTSKVKFNNSGDPYVTGLNGSDYRFYFGGADYRKIVAEARRIRLGR